MNPHIYCISERDYQEKRTREGPSKLKEYEDDSWSTNQISLSAQVSSTHNESVALVLIHLNRS